MDAKMICTYCQSPNPDSDHRCRRCGRRLAGSAVSAPAGYQPQAVGATALAIQPAPAPPKTQPPTRHSQTYLFADEFPPRVIPFDAQQRESLLKTSRAKRPLESNLAETAEAVPPRPRHTVKPAVRKSPAGDPRGEQSTLDFLPNAPQTARTLRTNVEAVIFCDAPVAVPMHRATAALLDGSMVFLGIGIFLVIFQIFGGPFTWSRQNIVVCASAVALISMFYGFMWALCGRETAGMRWTGLRLMNFNGFTPDGKSRALRLVGCWLSWSSGLIGIFWALVDEENLTWHDHMSKTFPTFRESTATLARPPL